MILHLNVAVSCDNFDSETYLAEYLQFFFPENYEIRRFLA